MVLKQIIPGKKSQPADNNQSHDNHIHQHVSSVGGQGGKAGFVSKDIETGITKGGNRMKKGFEDTVGQAVLAKENKRNPRKEIS